MAEVTQSLDAVVLMGPFGAGKTHICSRMSAARIAHYTELEPIVYERLGNGPDFGLERATEYIRSSYYEQLSSLQRVVAFESTGVTQRPLLMEVMDFTFLLESEHDQNDKREVII
jgi:hypothetical protein